MRDEYDFSPGRRGAVIASSGKTQITLFLDDDILEAFRAQAEAQGCGYQSLINAALRNALHPGQAPVTEEALRKIIREELRVA